ncbi:phage tail fiber protein [Nocardioides nematodiphilus]|uniref:phage tail fiber protein n=1 Tax=Nocardioides nematodiphilus TaxID=2849669 RepID=UPI001CDA3690|nr:hypothetical protein [Nocardioides nematodiphilus]MCA1984791.1 hypothetical protein [Nocardioides nematodiphilus]
MALTDGTLNLMGTYLAGLCGYASIHTANPGTTGASESTAARKAVTFSVDADGDLTLSATVNFTGGAASGPATYVGLWSAATGGTFRGGYALTGDQAFNAAGQYNLTSLTINGTAS